MQQSGRAVGRGVIAPPDPNAYLDAPRGSIFVEFDIDERALAQGGHEQWFIIVTEYTAQGRLARRRGEALPDTSVQNIEQKSHVIIRD